MVMAQYNLAEWIGTSHYYAGRAGQRAAWIIVHGTAGGDSAQEVAGWFQSNNPPTSTHYVIGQDGSVVQCVAEENAAWGNGFLSTGHDSWWNENINPNFQTISIEHVKPDPRNATALTQQQQEASFALIAYLCAKWSIPTHPADASGGITGHYSIDPVNRADCPGNYPWAALFQFLHSPGLGSSGGGPLNYLVNTVTQVQRAPLSGGVLGIIEQIDKWQQLPTFPGGNTVEWAANPGPIIAFGLGFAEAISVRTLIILMGVTLVLLALWNTMRQILEAEGQVAGPIIQAATSGAL